MTTAIPQNKFLSIKDKLKSFFSNKVNIVFFGLFSILLLYYCFFISDNSKDFRLTYNDSDNAKFTSIVEPFEAKIRISTKNLTGIHLLVQSNDGKDLENDDFIVQINNIPESQYKLTIENHNNETSFLKFDFANTRKHKYFDKELSIKIQSNKATLKVLDDNQIIYKEYGPLKIIPIILIPLLVIISFIFFYFVFKSNSWKKETKFLFFAIILGSVYIFVRPPCSMYDELIHYDSVYNISNIMLGYGNALETGVLPKRECDLNLFQNQYPYTYDNDHNANYNSQRGYYEHFIKNLFGNDTTTIVDSLNSKVLKPQRGYLISAIFLTIGRLLHFNQFALYYFVVIANLCISIFLIYYTSKKNKFIENNIILIISLFSVILMEFGSFSYDSILISVSFSIINLSISLFYSEKKAKSDFVLLLCLSIYLFPIKVIYFPISLYFLFLLIWSKIKHLFPKIIPIVFLVSLAIYFIICYFLSNVNIPFIHNNGTNYSIYDIIINPINTIKVIYNSIFIETTWFRWDEFFFFISNEKPKLSFLKTLFTLLLFLSFCIKGNKDKNILIPNIFTFILVSIFAFIVCMSWTKFGDNTVWGMQIRYLFPVMPLLFYVTENFIPDSFTIKYSTVINFTLLLGYFYSIDSFLQIL